MQGVTKKVSGWGGVYIVARNLGDLVDVAVWGNVPSTRMGGGSTEHVFACSGGVVVVALKDLVPVNFP